MEKIALHKTISVLNVFCIRLNERIAAYWLWFAHILGRVNSTIILCFIFFVVVTPIAYFYRMFNKKSVEHFRVNKRTSYFDTVDHGYQREDFFKQW